jgi:WD40 repeat protein
MNRLYRLLLLGISVIVFAAIAPLVVFYAMGYRGSLHPQQSVPAGVLLVETTPRRAALTIDDKYVGLTPRAISGLNAGEIRVHVSKEGYASWEKRVTIEPGLITEFPSIRLFPEQTHPLPLQMDTTRAVLSPSNQLLAAINQGQISIIDKEGGSVAAPLKLNELPTKLLWSPDSAWLLLQFASGRSEVIEIGSTLRRHSLPTAVTGQEMLWDPRIPGRLLTVTTTHNLLAYNVTTNSTDNLVSQVATFTTSTRRIYAIHTTGQLSVHNLQGDMVQEIPVNLKKVTEVKSTAQDELALLFSDQSVNLWDASRGLSALAQPAKSISWSPDGQLLLLQPNANELFVYNNSNERLPFLPVGQVHLITRLSRPIQHTQWFADGQHLIYQIDDQIIISEIDTRDYPASVVVDSTNNGNASVNVGTNGEEIYYLKNINGRSTLVRASLAVP